MGLEFKDKGPWEVAESKGRVRLYSDDFTHDVSLEVNGDFSTIEGKIKYAQALAEVLNKQNGNN